MAAKVTPGLKTLRLVLVVSQPEEARLLRERWAAREPDLYVLTAPGIAEALPYVVNWYADAVVCDQALLGPEALTDLLHGTGGRQVPLVALVPPGGEEPAAHLLEQGVAACVTKTGNYHLLLTATVRRLVQQAKTTPASGFVRSSPTRVDLEELGTILRHEINNPLTGILGNAELILAAGSELPATLRPRVETIIELAVRLRDLLRNLEQMVTRLQNLPPRSTNRVAVGKPR